MRLSTPLLFCLSVLFVRCADAQEHAHHAHHPATDEAQPAPMKTPSHPAGHGHGSNAAAPREPIPVPDDADRLAAFPVLSGHMAHAPHIHSRVLFNRLEAQDGAHGSGQAWEASAWIGGDTQRVWLRSEGERAGGTTHAADLEVLYGHSVDAWWDVLAGVRHAFAPGDADTWVAFGVQGMAPYRFEVSATGYVGKGGRTAASVEVEYDLLLTNRLVLQPLVEASLHGQTDAARGIGSGLSSVEAGVRMRYEVTRRFAPYLGYRWSRAYGRTADLREAAGDDVSEDGWVAGIRVWF